LRERLAALLGDDLGFAGRPSAYATHSMHAFAAKFPPQLPQAAIAALSSPGEVVLDPLAGSGTTLVEALLLGRQAIGVDLDPLACLVATAKTTPLDPAMAAAAGQTILERARALLAQPVEIDRILARRFDARTRRFVDFWFSPPIQRQLAALAESIDGASLAADVRTFLRICLSAIIVTKSGGVTLARDLAHSRPHRVASKRPRDALANFAARLARNARAVGALATARAAAVMQRGDARALPLPAGAVHLVVTSPPYASAIDYMRAHKFALVWLGYSIGDLAALRRAYIGAEVASGNGEPLPDRPSAAIRAVAARDAGRAGVLRRYFADMRWALAEMYRVLVPGRAAIVVVGSSTVRGVDVQTHACLADLARAVDFDVVGVVPRPLDRDRRLMPARWGSNGASGIERRMHEEHVLGLLRPAG
jgi:DNA modification methylase